ncbi:hypothetical protein V7795_35530 [Rhizobium laguerreae]|uniref:hypothetical protein n=1 Tax=Rhizobium laguerreae TaxID=1076926 RepID=UPI002FFD8FF6
MPAVSPTPIMPPDEHITAREALDPLYERLALHTDATLLSAAIEAGWPANEATKAVAACWFPRRTEPVRCIISIEN